MVDGKGNDGNAEGRGMGVSELVGEGGCGSLIAEKRWKLRWEGYREYDEGRGKGTKKMMKGEGSEEYNAEALMVEEGRRIE